MKSDNKKTGKLGEDLACQFLQDKGFLVIERNFSTRFGEIDIVCLDGEILVFVEVKIKIGHDFGEPEEMVNKSKLARVQRMGEVYIEVRNTSKSCSRVPVSGNPRMDMTARDFVSCSCTSCEALKSWSGSCRVDVVGVVLTKTGVVEAIRHYEAVY